MPPAGRTTRGPPARSPVECSPDRFRSSHNSPLAFWRQGPHFHGTERGRWAARRPIEGRVEGGEFHDYESPELLLGVSEGAILHAPLSLLNPNRRRCLWHLKWLAT